MNKGFDFGGLNYPEGCLPCNGEYDDCEKTLKIVQRHPQEENEKVSVETRWVNGKENCGAHVDASKEEGENGNRSCSRVRLCVCVTLLLLTVAGAVVLGITLHNSKQESAIRVDSETKMSAQEQIVIDLQSVAPEEEQVIDLQSGDPPGGSSESLQNSGSAEAGQHNQEDTPPPPPNLSPLPPNLPPLPDLPHLPDLPPLPSPNSDPDPAENEAKSHFGTGAKEEEEEEEPGPPEEVLVAKWNDGRNHAQPPEDASLDLNNKTEGEVSPPDSEEKEEEYNKSDNSEQNSENTSRRDPDQRDRSEQNSQPKKLLNVSPRFSFTSGGLRGYKNKSLRNADDGETIANVMSEPSPDDGPNN